MGKHVVGNIQGNDVIYSEEDKTVFCKNTSLPYKLLREAIDSPLDRIKLKDDLYYINHGFNISLGCLTFNKTEYKQMVNNIEKINNENRNY